jgi:hypothetical protein
MRPDLECGVAGFGDNCKANLQDIATLTGGEVGGGCSLPLHAACVPFPI